MGQLVPRRRRTYRVGGFDGPCRAKGHAIELLILFMSGSYYRESLVLWIFLQLRLMWSDNRSAHASCSNNKGLANVISGRRIRNSGRLSSLSIYRRSLDCVVDRIWCDMQEGSAGVSSAPAVHISSTRRNASPASTDTLSDRVLSTISRTVQKVVMISPEHRMKTTNI